MKFLLSRVLSTTLFTIVFSVPSQAQALLSNEAKINSIISQMTLEEKVDMLHGKHMFSSAGVERLGIADIEYADGPFGIREEMEPNSWKSLNLATDSATFFPLSSRRVRHLLPPGVRKWHTPMVAVWVLRPVFAEKT